MLSFLPPEIAEEGAAILPRRFKAHRTHGGCRTETDPSKLRPSTDRRCLTSPAATSTLFWHVPALEGYLTATDGDHRSKAPGAHSDFGDRDSYGRSEAVGPAYAGILDAFGPLG